jgi:YlmC/YmxH family sporulation protein
MLIKVSELRDMEVINIQDGRRLGLIMDIEMDLDEGYITSLILPDEPITGITALFRSSREILIDFEQIVKIGVDVILVDLKRIISDKKPVYSEEELLT